MQMILVKSIRARAQNGRKPRTRRRTNGIAQSPRRVIPFAHDVDRLPSLQRKQTDIEGVARCVFAQPTRILAIPVPASEPANSRKPA